MVIINKRGVVATKATRHISVEENLKKLGLKKTAKHEHEKLLKNN